MGGYAGRLGDSGDQVRLLRAGSPPADQPNRVPGIQEDEVLYDDLPRLAGRRRRHRTVAAAYGADDAGQRRGQLGRGAADTGPRGRCAAR